MRWLTNRTGYNDAELEHEHIIVIQFDSIPKNKAIIFCHGSHCRAFDPLMTTVRFTELLIFYTPHNHQLMQTAINYSAFGWRSRWVQRFLSGTIVPNYRLTSLDPLSEEAEDWEELNFIVTEPGQRITSDYDIILPEPGYGMTLHDVFVALRELKLSYDSIECQFCRGSEPMSLDIAPLVYREFKKRK